jgi:2'-5' RNA ligase
MNPTAAATPRARLFLALVPSPAIRNALATWQARWAWPPGTVPAAPEGLHLTLHFIGSVPRERVPEIARQLALPAPRFTLALGRAELWPRGLAVCCPSALPAALTALHARLADALRGAALPVEARAFRPHITLARKAAGAVAPAEPLALRWAVQGYALMESRGGYRVLARYGPRGLIAMAPACRAP